MIWIQKRMNLYDFYPVYVIQCTWMKTDTGWLLTWAIIKWFAIKINRIQLGTLIKKLRNESTP